MQETQMEAKSETVEKEIPVRESDLKSSFNDAEYERWSENLRQRNGSKGPLERNRF